MYEIKTEDTYEDFNKEKEMFDFRNYSAKSKYYNYSKKYVVGKMNDEKACDTIEKFVGLKLKMFWQMIVVSIKRQRGCIETLLQQKVIMDTKMVNGIKIVFDEQNPK